MKSNFYLILIITIFLNNYLKSDFEFASTSNIDSNKQIELHSKDFSYEKILKFYDDTYFLIFYPLINDMPAIFLSQKELIILTDNKCKINTISIKTIKERHQKIPENKYYHNNKELHLANQLKKDLLKKNKKRFGEFNKLSQNKIEEKIEYLTKTTEEMKLFSLFIDAEERESYNIIHSKIPIVGNDQKKNQYCNFFYSKKLEENSFFFSIMQYQNNYYPAEDQKSFLLLGYYLATDIKMAENSFRTILQDNLYSLWHQIEPNDNIGYLYFWIKSISSYEEENAKNEYEGEYFQNLFFDIFDDSLLEFTIKPYKQNSNFEIIKMKINYSKFNNTNK